MRLRIRYRSADDELTERMISAIAVEPPNSIQAYCHLRSEERTFVLSRIEHAIDLDTGGVVPDVWVYFGLQSRKPASLQMPTFSEQPTPLTAEEAQRRRTVDKRGLFGRFKLEVVQIAKRAELFRLFENRCYKCRFSKGLELDHHVPQYYGGRLVPGNIVLLCARCNSKKGDRHPREFYTEEESERLKTLLVAQLRLFDFTFDWSRWDRDPKTYLLSLGVPEDDVDAAIKKREARISVTIGLR